MWIDGWGKSDTCPVRAPGIAFIIERIVKLEHIRNGMKVRIGKRDISSSLRRADVRPDCSKVVVHAFGKTDVGCEQNCCAVFLSITLGFLASPSYFSIVTTSILCINQSFRPRDETRRIIEPYTAVLYIGDGIFVETDR